MNTKFINVILPLLNSYKNILRKKFSFNKAEEKIKQLRLKRHQLNSANEFGLYDIAHNIIKDLEKYINKVEDDPVSHFGVAEFFDYFKNTMAEFHLENNRIINAKQEASRASLDAIQLISLSKEKYFEDLQVKLKDCVDKINKYGSEEQRKALKNTFVQYINQYPNLHHFIAQIED
jgi:hypothetical protein